MSLCHPWFQAVCLPKQCRSLSPGNAMLESGCRRDGERLQPEKGESTPLCDLAHGNPTSQEDGGKITRQVILSCCVQGRKERYGLQDDCLCPLFLLSLLAGSFPFFPTHIYSSCFACESHTKRISKAAGSTSSFSRKTGGPGDFGL